MGRIGEKINDTVGWFANMNVVLQLPAIAKCIQPQSGSSSLLRIQSALERIGKSATAIAFG